MFSLKDLPIIGSGSFDVDGKVAVITGAAQGIGLALATELHRRGAYVAIVANPGVTPPPATLLTIDPADYDRVIAINQTGVWNTVRPALEQIIATEGHVVVVSSVAAFAPGPGGAAYMISKAPVEQFGRALRPELSIHGASAGVAYFGVVDTTMARDMLDDPFGRALEQLLPQPLRASITPDQAARIIADGIGHRAPRTLAPATWQPWSLLRGAINIVVDDLALRDTRTHALLPRTRSACHRATRSVGRGTDSEHSDG